MKILLAVLLGGLLATVGPPARSAAADPESGQGGTYTLAFEPTQNAVAGRYGEMTIKPLPRGTLGAVKLRGGYPDNVYTIWTVYNRLVLPLPSDPPCTPIKVATTWLRKFIGDYSPAERLSACANYEALAVRPGIDPRYWQCIDPATGLPRVQRYKFDHFRLAPHPDDLTHGLFGGNGTDHFIDMVGRRCQITPPIDDPCPQALPLPVAQPLATQPLATP